MSVIAAQATRAQAQRTLVELFAAAGIASARIDARVLLCAALGIDHGALVRDPGVPVGAAAARLSGYVARRLQHEPVSRILGTREFWGLSFNIGPAVLDPRPDTEAVIETVLDHMAARRGEELRLLDLGSGSGVILCALLSEFANARGVGVDASLAACHIARSNLAALGLARRGGIIQGCWDAALRGRFDVVVSNPPYIAHGDLDDLDPDVRLYDPAMALDGGDDGLDPYRIIVPRLPHRLARGGIAALECGATQGASILAMMKAEGLAGTGVRRDLAGHDRVVFVTGDASVLDDGSPRDGGR